MGKRGPQLRRKIKIEWSGDFAYAIGLIVTDGNLAKDGSRITLVSKDLEQIENFKKCLKLDNKIGIHRSGSSEEKGYRIQFRDPVFCKFLNGIGIFPVKSNTIGKIAIPKDYFGDYVRGCFDGDGSVHSYWDSRWKTSFMFYVSFVSASERYISWLRNEMHILFSVTGHVTKANKSSVFQLKYAKADSQRVINEMYQNKTGVCLNRKRLKIKEILDIVMKFS